MGFSFNSIFLMNNSSIKNLGTKVPDLNKVRQIACGAYHRVFLLKDGTVRTVGSNDYGQCGTGTSRDNISELYTIPNLTNVKQIACGAHHTAFLLEDGTVKLVGNNECGQIGTGSYYRSHTQLYAIPNLTNVKQVVCGMYFNIFILEDGTIRTIGANESGQCATGSKFARQLTLYKPNITNVKQACGGFKHSVFLLEDCTVRTVGENNYGQLGSGNTSSTTYLYTPNISNVKQVDCGHDFTTFLLEDGTIRTCGENNSGQCATGNTNTQIYLYKPNIDNVKQIQCGIYHLALLLNDGTVRLVGNNSKGQCSTDDKSSYILYLNDPGLKNVKSLWGINNKNITHLINQYNNYYTLDPNYYDINNFTPLTFSNGSTPSKQDLINFGFDDPNELINDWNINGETFKPIDKLSNNFEMRTFEIK